MKRFKTLSLLMLVFCLALLGAWMAAASAELPGPLSPAQTSEDAAAVLQTQPGSVSEEAEACLASWSADSEGDADLLGLSRAPGAQCCIDQCRRNRDCDAVCGAQGAGVCIKVNSCCRECACLF